MGGVQIVVEQAVRRRAAVVVTVVGADQFGGSGQETAPGDDEP